MLITKQIGIDMAHRVLNHKSKCRNLHGHRYEIEVGVDDKLVTEEGASDEGMVIDFSDLKAIMMDVLDGQYDHSTVLFVDDPLVDVLLPSFQVMQLKHTLVDFIPTAENLAVLWYNQLQPRLQERGIKLAHVKVWETPSSTVIYRGGEHA